jgi:hypothetical protein
MESSRTIEALMNIVTFPQIKFLWKRYLWLKLWEKNQSLQMQPYAIQSEKEKN